MAKKVQKAQNTMRKNVVAKTKERVAPKGVSVERAPIQPLNDRIVVRALTPEEAGTRSPSGIIIPDTISKEKPEQGIVVAVGPGRYDDDGERRIPLSVSKGDRVIFSKYGVDEVKVGGVEYLVVSEASVLAIIN